MKRPLLCQLTWYVRILAERALTVAGGDVANGKLAEVVAGHLGLDLDGREHLALAKERVCVRAYLAVVDANHGADHLRHHNHVTHVRAHDGGLLVRLSLLLGLAQLFDEGHRPTLQTTREAPAGTGVHQLNKVFVRHVEQVIEVHTAVRKLAEGPLALQLCGGSGVVAIPAMVSALSRAGRTSSTV